MLQGMSRIISNKPDLISALSVSYLTMFNYITTQQFSIGSLLKILCIQGLPLYSLFNRYVMSYTAYHPKTPLNPESLLFQF